MDNKIENNDNLKQFKLEEGFIYVAQVKVDQVRQIASFNGMIWHGDICLMEFNTQLAGGLARIADEKYLRRFMWDRIDKDVLRRLSVERMRLSE